MTPLLLILLGALSLVRAQGADGLVMNTPTTLTTCQNARWVAKETALV